MDLRRRKLLTGYAAGLALSLTLACSDRGHVVVLTEEPTAQVWIDGKQAGPIGPGGFEVAGGPHTVEVRAEGHHPWSADIEVSSDRPTVLQVELLGLAGFLVVRSNVSGDTVWVGETPLGPSGPHRHEIPSGTHVVRIERPGYTPYLQTVVVDPDATVTVEAVLVNAAVGTGPPHAETRVVPVPVPGYVPGPRYPYYGVPRPPVPHRVPHPRPPRPRFP